MGLIKIFIFTIAGILTLCLLIGAKFGGIDRRFDDIDRHFDDIDRHFDEVVKGLEERDRIIEAHAARMSAINAEILAEIKKIKGGEESGGPE